MAKDAGDNVIGGGEGGFCVAGIDAGFSDQCAGLGGVRNVDFDKLGSLLGAGRIGGKDGGDRLADGTGLAVGEEGEIGGFLQRHQGVDRQIAQISDIVAAMGCDDVGCLVGKGEVNADDRAAGHRAAGEGKVQGVGQGHVINVACPSGKAGGGRCTRGRVLISHMGRPGMVF